MYQVIIVEDEYFARLSIRNNVPWGKYDMQVHCDVATSEEAWVAIQESCPDILITDIIMPGKGGEWLVQQLYEAGLHPYIMVLTCLEEFEILQRMVSFGIRDYLVKSTMTTDTIIASIEKAKHFLDQRQGANKALTIPQNTYRYWVVQEYLKGALQQQEVRDCFEEIGIFRQGPALVILGLIDYVNENGEISCHSLPDKCEKLSGLIEAQSIYEYGSLCITMDSRRFVWFLFPEKEISMRELGLQVEELFSVLSAVKDELQDYLNLSFSLLIDKTEDLGMLPDCYRRLCKAAEKHYLHDESSIYHAEQYRTDVPMVCQPLKVYAEWVGSIHGYDAGRRFETCLEEIIEDSSESQEKMVFSLLKFSYMVANMFENWGIKKEQEMCERRIMHSPNLKKGIDALVTLLELCKVKYDGAKGHFRSEIQAALSYMEQNLSDPYISLSTVAELVGLSNNYFSTIFRSETKQTFRQYLINARIEKAKYLLENTDYRISKIAEETGFADEGYFSKVFKKVVHVSPKDWRDL